MREVLQCGPNCFCACLESLQWDLGIQPQAIIGKCDIPAKFPKVFNPDGSTISCSGVELNAMLQCLGIAQYWVEYAKAGPALTTWCYNTFMAILNNLAGKQLLLAYQGPALHYVRFSAVVNGGIEIMDPATGSIRTMDQSEINYNKPMIWELIP